MKNTHARKVIIIILAVVILFGAAGAAIWRFMPQEEDNTADPFALLSEGFTDRKVVDEDSALAAIGDVAQVLGIENVNAEFSNCEVNTVFSNIYYKFQQEYKGIPVYGHSVIIGADESEKAITLSGNYVPTDDIPTSPSVKEEDIRLSIEKYIRTSLGITNAENIFVEKISDNNLCIYNLGADSQSRLAYELFVSFFSDKIGQYQVVVDALNGEVLCAVQTIYEENATGYLSSDSNREKGFNIRKEQNEKYTLADDTRQLTVKTFNGAISQYTVINENGEKTEVFDEERAKSVYSHDNIWGNTDVEKSLNCESGATLLMNVGDIFDYYKDRLGFNPKIPVTLYYNDGYDNGNNALGGMIENHGVISMGAQRGVNELDVIAHEYTHFVSRKIVNWGDGFESGALNEAISDVMGEVIESTVQKSQIDWKMSTLRDIANHDSNTYSSEYCYYEHNEKECPIKKIFGSHSKNADYTKTLVDCWVKEYYNYPSAYKDQNWIDDNDSHINSIVISHAAYLMWKGIDGSDVFEPLSTEELAKLFYETLYTLPSDCTFSQFRALVQNTARYQDLSDKQRSCVSNAFFQVGITPAAMPVMKDHLSVEIYDIKGLIYDNYTLYVQHGNSEQKYSGEDINEQGLTFPESGEYRLRIVDNANTDNETIVSVTAVDHGGVEKMPIFTRCGLSKVDDLIGLLETDEEELSSIDYNNLVTEAYTETYTDEFGTYIWRIPEIMLSGDDIESINNEIWETLFTGAVSQNHEGIQQGGTFVAYDVIDYTWAVNGNILSLVTTTNASTMSWTDYYVYNVDITTGRSLSRDTLLNTYGYSYDEYNKLAEQVLGSKFWSAWDRNNENFQNDDFISWFNEALQKTISQENIDQSFPYINDKGELCIIAKVYSLAGADYYWNNLNMVNFTLVPDYATPVESNTHTNNASGKGWREAYESTLLQHPESTPFTYGSKTVYFDTEYTLYDIDKNEIPELIVKEDTDKYYIYSFDETGVVSYDMNFWNYDKCLYECQENGIIVYDGGMGSMRIEYVSLYSIENNELERVETLISTEEHSFDELYSFLDDLTPIDDFHPITDHSYLFN